MTKARMVEQTFNNSQFFAPLEYNCMIKCHTIILLFVLKQKKACILNGKMELLTKSKFIIF